MAAPRPAAPWLRIETERDAVIMLGELAVDADPESFRAIDPGWTPTLPARRVGAFGLADILVPVTP